MPTAKIKINANSLALSTSSKELDQIVDTLPNRHPSKTLPTIYPSAELLSLFARHFSDTVVNIRESNAFEPVHITSILVNGTTAATFYSLEESSSDPLSKNAFVILVLGHHKTFHLAYRPRSST